MFPGSWYRAQIANTLVFDVTDAQRVRLMETELNGSELTFSIPAGTLREFVLVRTDQSFISPEVVGEVENQNPTCLGAKRHDHHSGLKLSKRKRNGWRRNTGQQTD